VIWEANKAINKNLDTKIKIKEVELLMKNNIKDDDENLETLHD